MNILILSISAGGGHLKAAEAIKEVVEHRYAGSKTLILDTLKVLSPFFDKLVVGSYLKSLKRTPILYKKLYKISENGGYIYGLSKYVNKLLSSKLKKIIDQFNPDVVVCTHPFPLQMLSALKDNHKISTPIAAILTDFVVHPLWLQSGVDAYVVGQDFMKLDMIKRGIPEQKVHSLGIPVSSSFLSNMERSKLFKQYGLDNRQTVLIMGGSLGIGEIRTTFEYFINSKRNLQVIVVTGSNTKLMKQLLNISCNCTKTVKIFGYTERVADLMLISDFIITKPGGLTVSEALIMELPIFIMSPLPGQEEYNSRFLVNNGAAVRVFTNDDLESILSQILDNPLRMRHMKEMAKHIAKPNCCNDFICLLEKLTSKSSNAKVSIQND